MDKTYTDELAGCKVTNTNVILRCDDKGIITCRGPDNNKKHWKKCSERTNPKCPMTLVAEHMKKERQKVSLTRMERLLAVIKSASKGSISK